MPLRTAAPTDEPRGIAAAVADTPTDQDDGSPPAADPPELHSWFEPLAPEEAVAPLEPVRPRRHLARASIVWLAAALVVVLGGSGLFLSGYSLGRSAATTPGTPVDESQLFQPFWDAYRSVTERYAGGPVDRQKLVEGAIKGMISALGDPYSMYLSPDELRQSLEGVNGQFEGVGAQIGTRSASGTSKTCTIVGPDCRLVVIAPIEGSPASRSGVMAGDVIATIDGLRLDGLTVDAARDKVRGPRGTTVVLGIVRGKATLSISIVRDVVEQKVVSGHDLALGHVGYIRISQFTTDAPTDFDALLAADLRGGVRKFVVDVRGDPGGFVDAARAIASEFIASGPIFFQEDSTGARVETDATGDGIATGPSIKVVVLVDGGSASASEIFAGAMQDRGRATLVGQKTFGKGTMQQWNQLEDGAGGFRLTIARWLTPDGRSIHETGIEPDVVVPPAPNGQVDAPIARALDLLGESGAAVPAG